MNEARAYKNTSTHSKLDTQSKRQFRVVGSSNRVSYNQASSSSSNNTLRNEVPRFRLVQTTEVQAGELPRTSRKEYSIAQSSEVLAPTMPSVQRLKKHWSTHISYGSFEGQTWDFMSKNMAWICFFAGLVYGSLLAVLYVLS